ncbi:MAG: hypothetical protein GY875_03080 [Gammaproteobacteria bacterium]|nr:hypothetical protein [Gammaproteobacteria bacterium]
MANSVYTGADGSITLSTPEGTEGESAQTVIDEHEMVSVGRATGVRFETKSDVKPFHEIGQRYASELRPGNIHINGTIDRAYINGALLKLLLGEAATSRPPASWAQPAFNITVMVDNPALPGTRSSITLHQVKLDQWNYTMPEDDFVMEEASFQALYLTVEDEAA